MRTGDGKGQSGPSTLVVDHWLNKETAENKLQATSLSSCDEAFWDGRWLLILHSSQTAWLPAQQNDLDTMNRHKLYWSYILDHPAHAEISMAKWMAEAHGQALLFLKWCAFEALTSSTAKTPFPLKHSNDLANLLTSLDEDPVDDDRDGQTALRVYTQAGSSEEQALETASDGRKVQTAAQESYKLRTSLIAKVLMAKYSQLSAVDAQDGSKQPHKSSKTLDVLFWIVDIASLGSFLRYLRRLDEVRDTLLTDDKWRDHIWRLVKEWEEFNLISTVLLSASAGILALDNIGGISRTAILISILGSFGGITTGLYCITMYQPRAPNSRDSIDRTNALTMFKYNQYTLTHKGIAMVLGLPMAFLVWSLVAFMVGILSFSIVATETSGHVSGVAYAVVSVAAAIFLLIGIAFYSLARLWGSGQGRTFRENIRKQYMKVAQRWRPLAETKAAA
ncbi:hypothetical protein B0H14DRAFT_3431406 [Mycena olivaceomarginata]|nr:hypothetical protein B0H14DRAFT_3431406 [Mycena olivaceomarginata]